MRLLELNKKSLKKQTRTVNVKNVAKRIYLQAV